MRSLIGLDPMKQRAGGPPLAFCFFCPISKLRVPRPCVFCKGGYDAARTIVCYAGGLASDLRRASPALHYLVVLSPLASSNFGAGARPRSRYSRTNSAALSLCGGWLRRDARACPPADQRTGGGKPFDGHAGAKAAYSPRPAAAQKTPRPEAAQVVWRGCSAHFLAARFYDFNVWSARKRIEKLRYMHRNPVKRGLVAAPDQWRWSSYRFYLLDERGPVRINEGWPEISFSDRVA